MGLSILDRLYNLVESLTKNFPYYPFGIVWAGFTVLFSSVISSAALFGDEERWFNSRAYDWVREIMPMEVWGFIWLLVPLFNILAWLNYDSPYWAVRHLRRQFVVFAFLQGTWMVSIFWLIIEGSLPAVTAVLVWFGVFLTTIGILLMGKLYREEVAGFHWNGKRRHRRVQW